MAKSKHAVVPANQNDGMTKNSKSSGMLINDSVPVNKKIGELIKYKIFIMKCVEFAVSFVATCVTTALPLRGRMHRVATCPTIVISLMFIILYVRQKNPQFMEKMYLFFQILFTFGALVECLILENCGVGFLYFLFFGGLLVALCFDLYFIATERGCTFIVA